MNKEELKKKLPWIVFALILLGPLLKSGLGVVILIIFLIFLFKDEFNKFNIFPANKGNPKNMNNPIDVDQLKQLKNLKKIIISVVVILLLGWLFFASIVIVEAGETGVYSLFGKVKEAELSSGFHLVIPVAHVEKMSIRTEEYTMSVSTNEGKKQGVDSIAALTKEGLNVDLDMTV